MSDSRAETNYSASAGTYFPKIMKHVSNSVTFSGNKNTCINSGKKLYTAFSNNKLIKVELNYIYTYIPQKKTFLKGKSNLQL